MNVGLIGAGAVGAIIAHKLQKISNLFLIVDESRKASYETNGIFINGEKIVFNCLTPSSAKTCDLIILAVKNYDLPQAVEQMKPFVKEGTILLSLLNGVVSETILKKEFPLAKVLYAFIKDVSAIKLGNNIKLLALRGGTICFGAKDNVITKEVESVETLFKAADLDYEIPLDIHKAQWWKFMLNCCFNTLSAILLTPYSMIYDNEAFMKASLMVCEEVLKVAQAEKINLNQEDVDKVICQLRKCSDDGKTSMLQDVEAGRQTENDYFTGTVSALGKAHNMDTPICNFLYQLLEAASYARA